MTTPDLEDWTALPHGLLAHAHERVAELEAENARLREALMAALKGLSRIRLADCRPGHVHYVLDYRNDGQIPLGMDAAALRPTEE